ncbi:glutathionylspermidine synthase family protein [bacterium]|nr:MAG: glutathionylspermidine synthase family protein [bacterium]
MKREVISPRPNWIERVEEAGLTYSLDDDGSHFWNESVCYSFSLTEIERLEVAVDDLNKMCLKAVEHVITQRRLDQFGIPMTYWPFIERAWENEERTIYGRFDLWYDGSDIKLLEFNADTPTSLVEAAVAQWQWLQDVFPEGDQFNSIHERLVEAWGPVKSELGDKRVYFTSLDDGGEDFMTANYLRDTAHQAGIDTEYIAIENIGWHERRRVFTDLKERPIEAIFKLYPWEWLWKEAFGAHIPTAPTRWFESPWKAILSSKAILPVLWELYPDHPLLLRAAFSPWGDTYAQKPLWGREGANTRLVRGGKEVASNDGPYPGPFVYQELRELPDFDGAHPVCGAWLVNGWACGLGIREDARLITSNGSQFVPHRIASLS